MAAQFHFATTAVMGSSCSRLLVGQNVARAVYRHASTASLLPLRSYMHNTSPLKMKPSTTSKSHLLNECVRSQSRRGLVTTLVRDPSAVPVELNNTFRSGCLLWVSGIMRPKHGRFDVLWYITRIVQNRGKSSSGLPKYEKTLKNIAENICEVKMIIPQLQEGGAFLVVGSRAEANALISHINGTNVQLRCFEVLGEPFIHDVKGIVPSYRLHVQNDKGQGMTIDAIYAYFRKYGRISNISPHEPRPKSVHVTYSSQANAASAMKCLNRVCVESNADAIAHATAPVSHSATLTAPTFSMVYAPQDTMSIVKFVMNNTRVVVPMLIATMGVLSYTLFEPVRVWCVQQSIRYATRIQQTYSRGMSMMANSTTQFTRFLGTGTKNSPKEDMPKVETRRLEQALQPIAEELTEQVHEAFNEDSRAMVVIAGPVGSGKSFVAKKLVSEAPNVLFIDFSDHTLRGSAGSSYVESKLVRSIGYFPSFIWMNKISKVTESVAAATLGIKTDGLSSTSQDTVRQILNTLTKALGGFSVSPLDKCEAVLNGVVNDNNDTNEGCVDNNKTVGHNKSKEGSAAVVVVIEGIDRALTTKFPWMMDCLYDWVSQLSIQHGNSARVIMVTNDFTLADSAATAMSTPVKLIPVRDMDVEAAMKFLSTLTKIDLPTEKLSKAIDTVGGRFIDIQLLSKKINSGFEVEDATMVVIDDAIDYIRNHGLGISPMGQGRLKQVGSRAWTKEQMWYIITLLAESEHVPLDDLLFSPLFGGDLEPMRAMAEAGILVIEPTTCIETRSQMYVVRPTRPVLSAACKALVKDTRLSTAMDNMLYASQLSKSNEKLRGLEDEMEKLLKLGAAAWTGSGAVLNGRLRYISTAIQKETKKLNDLTDRKKL
eukprot:CFRG6299T1